MNVDTATRKVIERLQRAANAIAKSATPEDTWEYQEPYAKYSKVYVSDAAMVARVELEEAKQALLVGLQSGMVHLHRADLVEAMKYEPVVESEIRGPGRSTYHLIRAYAR